MAKQLRIPTHMVGTAKKVAARSWVYDKKFPEKKWFSSIDEIKGMVLSITGEEASEELIVLPLAAVVNLTPSLVDHIEKNNGEIPSDPAGWMNVCEAASWVIMQKYVNAVEKGEWPVA